MGCFTRIFKCFFKFILYFTIFFCIIVLVPNLPPYSQFTAIDLGPSLPLTGPLAPNTALNNAKKIFENKLTGPEAFQEFDGEIYTSLSTGEIVKVSPGGHVTFVTKIGQPCSGPMQDHICGRPLGFAIDKKTKTLYVADAYYGIWKVDLNTDKKQLLVSPQSEIAGHRPKLFNSIALDSKGLMYWTDSSYEFQLINGFHTLLTDPAGRLLSYNAAKNESTVLVDNLWFANGLAVSPDDQFIVVAESAAFKLTKYYIDGPKKGKSETFLAGIPGTPDNIRALPDGSGILVSLYTVADENNPMIARSLANTPIIRKFIIRLLLLIENSFDLLNQYVPNVVFEEIVYKIGSFQSAQLFIPKRPGLLQVDWNGNIVAAYYCTDESVTAISDAIVYNDLLYLGTPLNRHFISALPAPPLLKKAFVAKEAPKVDQKPVPKQTDEKFKPEPTLNKAKVEPVDKPKAANKPTEPKSVPSTPPTPVKPVTNKPLPSKQEEKAPSTPGAPKKTDDKKQAETKPHAPAKQNIPKEADVKQSPPSKNEIPKETENKKAPPKQQESPKQQKVLKTDTKPQTKQTEAKPTPPPKQETKPVPVQQKETVKESDTKQKQPVTQSKTSDSKKDRTQADSKPSSDKTVPKQIPIKEEIPSDTAKPNKDTLKVIKKSGPAEIPNPSP